ncbi:MAG: MMPL family transporter [Thermoflavifilum aggregans]|nr:MMPL family transporter [Thermoflavifilum aggregans]
MSWQRLASWILKKRLILLSLLGILTCIMAYFAAHVQLSYDFIKSIPLNDPKYKQYLAFKKTFGEDGNLMVIGYQTNHFFDSSFFHDYQQLVQRIQQVPYVEDVLSIPTALNLKKDDSLHRLQATLIFPSGSLSQPELDSLKNVFLSLPFYNGLLYNPETHSYLMAVHINKDILNTSGRTRIIDAIEQLADRFGQQHHITCYLSGIPYIRTVITNKLSRELRIFLISSVVLTALILLLFFRSLAAVWMSMTVVLIGVIWSLATIVLLGYKLTILTGLIPPLIVVIGIPNCVYFLNKYHSEYARHQNKVRALVRMVQRMGIVTLFTNLTAAIGFGVFFFTRSAVLKEFGIVAGINILWLFVISLVFLPAILSYLPAPKEKQVDYLDNPLLNWILKRLEILVFHYRPVVYAGTVLVLVFAIVGITRLTSVGYILDDVPHRDRLYTDLKFFERNFKGVMPLEILINTHHPNGVISLDLMNRIDAFSRYIARQPDFARPMSYVEGIKFARQAYYGGDSLSYAIPNQFDLVFLAPYLQFRPSASAGGNGFEKLLHAFVDSSKQTARLSINMKDVGTRRLPVLLQALQKKADSLFPASHYTLTYTGTSVVFLEGSRYIINGLTDSILLAFVLILGCMFYLFRSWKVVFISLVPNMIPLAFTAGVMGWLGVPLKPSTVLVFSVALGIAIDVTIRFLVNFKQEMQLVHYQMSEAVKRTIHDTGISIVYTGLILFAGFMIFSFSAFGGTQALGLLTSLTLILAMISNLTILPAMLLWLEKSLKRKARRHQLWPAVDEEKDLSLEELGLTELNHDTQPSSTEKQPRVKN